MNSHILTKKPSVILAAIALAIAHRHCPQWVAISLEEAANQAGWSAQRLSRLTTAILHPFKKLVDSLTRRGRPPGEKKEASSVQQELTLQKALLDVASKLLAHVKPRLPQVRQLIVGAYLRLKEEHNVTQSQFCLALSFSERTLRSWIKTSKLPSVKHENQPPEKEKKRKQTAHRIPGHSRFSLQVIPPQTQYAGDTTDLKAFGFTLKLMAIQDLGNRDQRLLEEIKIDEHETAEKVSGLLIDTLSSVPGAQVIFDQGKPYIAEVTKQTCEALELDLAIQKEGDPKGKSPLERGFGTVKSIANPLLMITNLLAAAIPAMKNLELSKFITRLVVSALLKAYASGSRAAFRGMEARQHCSLEQIEEYSAIAREKARAEGRSKRLLLAELYQLYNFGNKQEKYINRMKKYPLAVLLQAERAFRAQAHRGDIKDREAYFAAIVRNLNDIWQLEEAKRRRQKADDDEREADRMRCLSERKFFDEHPESELAFGLELLSQQVRTDGSLLFNGAGPGKGAIRLSIKRISELYAGKGGLEIALGVFDNFQRAFQEKIPSLALSKIESIFRHELEQFWPKGKDDPIALSTFADKIINIGVNQPPPHLENLRNYAARPCGS